MAWYPPCHEPFVAAAAVQMELTEDESEWTDGEGLCQNSHHGRTRRAGSRTGDESGPEGFFSDDTGFFSAPEPEDMDTEEDENGEEEVVAGNEVEGQLAGRRSNEQRQTAEEESDEQKQMKILVTQQYQGLINKYTNPKFSTVQDTVMGVNWTEMFVVLEMSADRSGLVVAAQLLDVMMQLFLRQLNNCRQYVFKIVEDLNRLNKRGQGQGRKGGQNKDNDPSNAIEDDEHDDGYYSQPLSQKSQLEDEVDEEERSDSRRKSRPYLHPGFKRSKKFIASDNDQLLNDFVKERSAHIVSRRVNLHEHWHQAVKNPYLDYQFDLAEYYEKTPEAMDAEAGKLAESAKDLFKEMKSFTSPQRMQKLHFPQIFWEEDDEEAVIEEEEECLEMEVDLPVHISGGDIIGNNENILPHILQDSAGESENVVVTVTNQNNLLVSQAGLQEEGEGGENVDPKEKDKKKKKRRIPLLEKNIAVLEFLVGMLPLLPGDEPESKRPRLDDNQEVIVGQVLQQSIEDPENGRLVNLENDILNASGIEKAQSCSNNNGDDIHNNYHMMNDHGGDERLEDFDLTPADYDGCFRPPSPLSKHDTPQIHFQTRTTRVNMSAIKSKFNDIITESQNQSQEEHSPSEITFVEILKKSELDILVGPNETIPSTSFCGNTSLHATPIAKPTCSDEVSVGVAFLAMLHNASHNNFFLVEDDEGGFKVSRQRPADPLPSSRDLDDQR